MTFFGALVLLVYARICLWPVDRKISHKRIFILLVVIFAFKIGVQLYGKHYGEKQNAIVKNYNCTLI